MLGSSSHLVPMWHLVFNDRLNTDKKSWTFFRFLMPGVTAFVHRFAQTSSPYRTLAEIRDLTGGLAFTARISLPVSGTGDMKLRQVDHRANHRRRSGDSGQTLSR
jgi:hypothetical protein